MKQHAAIDLHIHTTVSDGTEPPEVVLGSVKAKSLKLFSVTDHDAIKGCQIMQELLRPEDPQFICGVEFSCKDEQGQYHILGYNYDPMAASMQQIIQLGHSYRMKKVKARLDFLKERFHIEFPDFELEHLYSLDNPGKPHIGNLMVKYGYVKTKEEAFKHYMDKISFRNEYVRPEEAIMGILNGEGIPVLAHPSYGSGEQLIIGEEMEHRLRRLMDFGLQGVEAFYSEFTPSLQVEMLAFAEKYDLFVTAGSDYHGTNKPVILGETNLRADTPIPDGLLRFLEKVGFQARTL